MQSMGYVIISGEKYLHVCPWSIHSFRSIPSFRSIQARSVQAGCWSDPDPSPFHFKTNRGTSPCPAQIVSFEARQGFSVTEQ